MRPLPRILFNTPQIEVWPAWLLLARGNRDARALTQAQYVLRRKRDGRYLAAASRAGWQPLVPSPLRESGLMCALDLLRVAREERRDGVDRARPLPLDGLHARLDALGLDAAGYAARTGLALVAEPDRLQLAGFDRYARPLWLRAHAARAWTHLHAAAGADGVVLEAISGFRSHAYQLGIFERKLARGQTVDEILRVNAAPGFSEHHGGCVLDIGTPGEPPAETSFEATGAFAWLRANADCHGFVMSYPRDNPHGIDYEPWHWMYRPSQT